YQAEELKGKKATFKCTIKEVKEKELPELDDEFASEVSEYDTFKEYKEATVKSLEEKKANDAKNKKEDEAIEAIIKASEINIPEAMLETQKRQMVQDFAQNIQQNGLTMDQYFKFTGLTAEKLMEQVAPNAEKRIKSRLVLEGVAKAEKLEASEEDYAKELERMAEAYKMELDKIKEMIDDNSKKQIMDDLAIQKAVDFVVSNAKEA
ncbi:MAG: trigger factor, partial [Lachnospiraceae bacterium]|nr:trigger factor [Lachnospiraceae bacterium]